MHEVPSWPYPAMHVQSSRPSEPCRLSEEEGHGLQTLAPAASLYVPAAQGTHEPGPVLGFTEPGAHGEQAASATPSWPARQRHSDRASESAGDAVLLGHGAQSCSSWYVSTAHGEQDSDFRVRRSTSGTPTVPVSHAVHGALPDRVLYVPRAHASQPALSLVAVKPGSHRHAAALVDVDGADESSGQAWHVCGDTGWPGAAVWAAEKVSMPQSMHSTLEIAPSASVVLPAEHVSQASLPLDSLKVPSGHCAHVAGSVSSSRK